MFRSVGQRSYLDLTQRQITAQKHGGQPGSADMSVAGVIPLRGHLNCDVGTKGITRTVASEYSPKNHNETVALIRVGHILRHDTIGSGDAGAMISGSIVPSDHRVFG